jgi:hypothetical protein
MNDGRRRGNSADGEGLSYTTIIDIVPGVRHYHRVQLRNSWGSAPAIWDNMAQRYLGAPEYSYFTVLKDLWNLWMREDIPKPHRAVHMFTFDRAYVKNEDFRRMALDIDAFLSTMPIKADNVNHWPTIAEYLRKSRAKAVGLYCTSVSECDYCNGGLKDAFDLYAELDALPDARKK